MQVQDKIIMTVPEVQNVLGKAGRANTATDNAPMSMIETIIFLKPREEWRPGFTKDDIINELNSKLQIPGVVNTIGNAESRAVSIPEDQIESVKKVVNSGAVARPHPYLKEGDKVIVKYGQLAGAVGFYVKTNTEKGVLVISLDMLGRSVEIDIDVNLVNKF
jgi:transcription antitermination factor NusG